MSDQALFDGAMARVNDGYFDLAAKDFEQIEYLHPYSPLVSKSWLMAGYSSYLNGKYLDAAAYFDKFVKARPSAPEVPYAMYMVGISYYEAAGPITRDMRNSVQAQRAFEMLERNFPSSEYARDAKPKISLIANSLAAKEMLIAGELFRRRNLLASLDRYQGVIGRHGKTLFAPEALFRSAEIYDMIGEPGDADNMRRILRLNFPESEWAARL
jgi:outer membrane protein assembly factor BamD